MATKDEAQEALFAQIKKAAETIDDNGYVNPGHRASILRGLALAYCHAAGGPQPGSTD